MTLSEQQRNALAAKLVGYAQVLWFAYARDPERVGEDAKRLGVDIGEVECLAGGGADLAGNGHGTPASERTPWCEPCHSYHAKPKTKAEHTALRCLRPWRKKS